MLGNPTGDVFSHWSTGSVIVRQYVNQNRSKLENLIAQELKERAKIRDDDLKVEGDG